MKAQEYISTGILEAYALNELSESERATVREALEKYAEAREELQRVEETMEAIVFASAIKPPAKLKERLMKSIAQPQPLAKEIQLNNSGALWKYTAAASIAIALFTSALAYYYHQQWQETYVELAQIKVERQQIAEQYNVVNEKLDKIQGDLAVIENAAFTKVLMKGTTNESGGMASIYWNPSTQEVYLSVQQLKAISKENQFQLWAIVNGKPVDAGVFDLNFAGLLKMKNIKDASAFAVTVEPRGGVATPTHQTMRVLGTVPANPS